MSFFFFASLCLRFVGPGLQPGVFLLGYLLISGDMGGFAPCNVLDFQSPFAFGCEANLDIQLVCPNVPGDWDGSLKSVTRMHLPDVSPFQRMRARRSLQSRGRT